MSITDELRERIAAMCKVSGLDGERLYAIADRIDAKHRTALEKVAAMVDEPDETDEIERRIKALEHLTDGMLLAESEMEERVSAIERKLNHKGGAE